MSEDLNEQAQMLTAGQAINSGKGSLLAPTVDPAWAAQRAAEDEMYRTERERERQERYDLQNIVNRQTAMHAALMLEPKPHDPEDLVNASGVLLAFLTAKT